MCNRSVELFWNGICRTLSSFFLQTLFNILINIKHAWIISAEKTSSVVYFRINIKLIQFAPGFKSVCFRPSVSLCFCVSMKRGNHVVLNTHSLCYFSLVTECKSSRDWSLVAASLTESGVQSVSHPAWVIVLLRSAELKTGSRPAPVTQTMRQEVCRWTLTALCFTVAY